MTTFDDREKAYENKFAHDQELKFKAEARRNNLLGAWAAEKMGLSGDAVAEYQKEVRRADLEEAGDADVIRKIRADLHEKGVTVSHEELRAQSITFMEQVLAEIEAED